MVYTHFLRAQKITGALNGELLKGVIFQGSKRAIFPVFPDMKMHFVVHFQPFSSAYSNFPCGSCRGLMGIMGSAPSSFNSRQHHSPSHCCRSKTLGWCSRPSSNMCEKRPLGSSGCSKSRFGGIDRPLKSGGESGWLTSSHFGYPMLSRFYIHLFNVITYYHQHPDLAVSGLHHDSQAHKIQTHSTQYSQYFLHTPNRNPGPQMPKFGISERDDLPVNQQRCRKVTIEILDPFFAHFADHRSLRWSSHVSSRGFFWPLFCEIFAMVFGCFLRGTSGELEYRNAWLRWDSKHGMAFPGKPCQAFTPIPRSNIYPLVNVYIPMENHHVWWENSLFQWQCSIAIYVTNYQRVIPISDSTSIGPYPSISILPIRWINRINRTPIFSIPVPISVLFRWIYKRIDQVDCAFIGEMVRDFLETEDASVLDGLRVWIDWLSRGA